LADARLLESHTITQIFLWVLTSLKHAESNREQFVNSLMCFIRWRSNHSVT